MLGRDWYYPQESEWIMGYPIGWTDVAQLETLVQSIEAEGFAAKAYPGDARLEEDVIAMVDAIEWPQGFCRRDIGWRALG